MEKSKVYFTSFKATGNENLLQKLHRLMKTAGFENIDFKDKYAAIKIHFGERPQRQKQCDQKFSA